MSPGTDRDLSPAYLAVNSNADYERLCALDVLGLVDSPTGDQTDVYHEIKEQLVRSSEGWYETGLPWKGNCPTLSNNRNFFMLLIFIISFNKEYNQRITPTIMYIFTILHKNVHEKITKRQAERRHVE